MEKFGVQLDTEEVKTAQAGKKNVCPKCGEELVENNQFLMFCKNCGTEPWEKRSTDNGL